MRLHAGFHTPTAHFRVKVVDQISIPLGVATLRDNFSDVEEDAALCIDELPFENAWPILPLCGSTNP